MERVQALISKLQDQLNKGCEPVVMQVTLQMLQAELQQLSRNTTNELGTAKVAVVLPLSNHNQTISSPPLNNTNVTVEHDAKKHKEPHHTQPQKKQENQASFIFDLVGEVPTLAHQRPHKEVNDVMQITQTSLNDRLKASRSEVADTLVETPVRDLKKAIGINDRFVYINELFRGDETMYERSIKTINNFHILAEAEFWIERELKLKLGWTEDNALAKQFCQLVRRRFS